MFLLEETVDLLNPTLLGSLPAEEYEKFSRETGIVFRRMGGAELDRDWAFMPFSHPDTHHEDQVGSTLRGEIFDENYLYEDFHHQN